MVAKAHLRTPFQQVYHLVRIIQVDGPVTVVDTVIETLGIEVDPGPVQIDGRILVVKLKSACKILKGTVKLLLLTADNGPVDVNIGLPGIKFD